MKHKIKSLTVTGLKNHPELNYTIRFTEEFQDDNIFAITGPNGYGKTMVLDIINHTLQPYAYNLPYVNSIEKVHIELDGDFNFIDFNLKNNDKVNFWTDERYFSRTTQVTACMELPKALAVLDRTRTPDISYIFNPEPNMSQDIIDLINKWFRKFYMDKLRLTINDDGNPEFQIWNNRLTEKDMAYMSSGDTEILILLNALLEARYEDLDILLYDDLGLHLHNSIKLMLKSFIKDIKPEKTLFIYTTHSVEVMNFLFDKSQDLYTLSLK